MLWMTRFTDCLRFVFCWNNEIAKAEMWREMFWLPCPALPSLQPLLESLFIRA